MTLVTDLCTQDYPHHPGVDKFYLGPAPPSPPAAAAAVGSFPLEWFEEPGDAAAAAEDFCLMSGSSGSPPQHSHPSGQDVPQRRRSSYFRLRHYGGSLSSSESGSSLQHQEWMSSQAGIGGGDMLDVTGTAYLCFMGDYSAFVGHVLCDKGRDDSYRLVGKRISTVADSPADIPYSSTTTAQVPPAGYGYEVDVLDYADIDNISPVHINLVNCSRSSDNQLWLQTPPTPGQSKSTPTQQDAFCFHAKETHIGSRADVLIQRYFSSKFTDIDCFVCVGSICIKCPVTSEKFTREPETGVL